MLGCVEWNIILRYCFERLPICIAGAKKICHRLMHIPLFAWMQCKAGGPPHLTSLPHSQQQLRLRMGIKRGKKRERKDKKNPNIFFYKTFEASARKYVMNKTCSNKRWKIIIFGLFIRDNFFYGKPPSLFRRGKLIAGIRVWVSFSRQRNAE